MSKKKKIVFFLPNLNGGGAQNVFIRLFNNIDRTQYCVTLVVAIGTSGELHSNVIYKNEIVFLNGKRLLFTLFRYVGYIRKSKPDVILCTMSYVHIFNGLSILLSRYKKVSIFREANTIKENNSGYKKNKLLKNIYIWMMRFFYKRATHVIANSCDIAEDLNYYGVVPYNQVVIVPNPVIDNQFLDREKEKINELWLPKKNKKMILSVGSFRASKNFPMLIEAFSIVKKEIKDCYLVIIGEGGMREEYEKQIDELGVKNDVFLPGFINNPLPFMRNCEVFVSSSSWEGMPNVLIEAIAVGAKVVATDCPGATSVLLENEKYGSLTPINNVQMLADNIAKAIVKEKINSEVNKDFREKYSVKSILRKYEDLF